MNEELDYQIAESLLEIKAISFNASKPFVLASGLKSPIYCDIRLVLGYPAIRSLIADTFVSAIKEIGMPEVIAGTATAGIPHAAWVADRMKLPMVYVRSEAKEHGKGKQIEGIIKAGQRVVVLEDLISTGGSSVKAVKALQEVGANVLAVVSVFEYGLEVAAQNFAAIQIPYYSLASFETMLDIADLNGVLRIPEIDTLRDWQADPANWVAPTM